MEKTIQDNILAHCMELALMPALLYSYRDGGVLYWIVLILMDDYILRHQDVKGLLPLWGDARYKKGYPSAADSGGLYAGRYCDHRL